VYVQVVVDVFCSLAFAKLCTSKMPVSACDLLYERVLPFYDALGVSVGAILTDNGREFCGKPQSQLKGTTPAQALREALGRQDLPPIVPPREDAQQDLAAEATSAS
jgi:hypothetical protein